VAAAGGVIASADECRDRLEYTAGIELSQLETRVLLARLVGDSRLELVTQGGYRLRKPPAPDQLLHSQVRREVAGNQTRARMAQADSTAVEPELGQAQIEVDTLRKEKVAWRRVARDHREELLEASQYISRLERKLRESDAERSAAERPLRGELEDIRRHLEAKIVELEKELDVQKSFNNRLRRTARTASAVVLAVIGLAGIAAPFVVFMPTLAAFGVCSLGVIAVGGGVAIRYGSFWARVGTILGLIAGAAAIFYFLSIAARERPASNRPDTHQKDPKDPPRARVIPGPGGTRR
jgi:hypothetical protein